MATEPERKIEELLRAYAQKRKDQFGDHFALHPANRRLLQAEVAKLRKENRTPASGWLALLSQFWLRAGLAFSILLVLGVTLWWLNSGPKGTMELALQDTKEAPRSSTASPAPASPAPAPTTAPASRAMEDEKLAKAAPTRDAENVRSRLEPSTEAKLKASTGERSNTEFYAKRELAQNAPSEEMLEKQIVQQKKDALVEGLAKDTGTLARSRSVQDATKNPSTVAAPPVVAAPTPPPAPGAPALAQVDKLERQPMTPPPTPTQPGSAMRGAGGGFGGSAPTQLRPENMYGTFGGTGAVDGFAAKGMGLAEKTAPIGGARRGVVGAETNTLRGQIVDGKAATTNLEIADQDNAAGLGVARPEENMLALKSAPADQRRLGVGQPALNSGAPPVVTSREQYTSLPGTSLDRSSQPTPSLLNSFVVERTGNRIRLIDADGSIYEGELTTALEERGAQQSYAYRSRSSTTSNTAGDQVLLRGQLAEVPSVDQGPVSFRATGTNRTMNARVDIQASLPATAYLAGGPAPAQQLGSYFALQKPAAGRAAGTLEAPSRSDGPARQKSQETGAPPGNATVLEGTATLPNGTRVPIKAVRISR